MTPRIPSVNDHKNYFKGAVSRSDREAAIVAASFLELHLAAALYSRFRPLRSKFSKRIFRGYGPLSTFSAKIDLAFCLDLIDEDQRKDADIIRSIRNHFAHSLESLNFDELAISSKVESLSTLVRGDTMLSGVSLKAIYLKRAFDLAGHLAITCDLKPGRPVAAFE